MSVASVIPPPPKQSFLGWPLIDRREEFKKLLAQPHAETHRIENFKGGTVSLPILRVPINLPKYRIANGRTASAQQEFAALHSYQPDFFDNGDPELEDIQQSQHQILQSMVKDEGLLRKFEVSANKQVEPLLLDENGFVLNGNRRLCCWRLLYQNDTKEYGHFSHVDVVVLPHCDEQELDRLEARLQIEKDIRSDYTWDAEAAMMLQKQKLHGFSTAQLCQLYGKKKSEIEDLLAMRNLAAEYLETRGKANTWSEVSGDKYAFQELLKALSATDSASDREIIKHAAFSLIDDSGGAGERLYAVIPKVKVHLEAVKTGLAEAFPLPAPEVDEAAEMAFGSGKPEKSAVTAPPPAIALVAEMRKDEESLKKARDVVIEVIRSQDEQGKEREAADFLAKTLKKANTLIQNAVGHGLRPETSIAGVKAQLEQIRSGVEAIETWLSEKEG
ncbi:hypothetical protein [Gulbenkiania mobilis]|uniref:ParB/Sulfiredoxin domain-containing protein n=1 Tax=Gulbenkiania mobilis TaxID=397457 RepID=A0ABY2CY32_GULMO|nr:hypothetical protein EV669_103290 [Gulbenkiania mobilis]